MSSTQPDTKRKVLSWLEIKAMLRLGATLEYQCSTRLGPHKGKNWFEKVRMMPGDSTRVEMGFVGSESGPGCFSFENMDKCMDNKRFRLP
jgi:hypothetical protein